MVSGLSIKNYALIDQLDISFNSGLTIITGETGAGKSVLMGALSLITGQRADSGVLQDKENKCVVEASFRVKGLNLEEFFQQNDLDYSDETLVRREISPEGKSRAFINDTPVNLNVLRYLGEKLVDIHSQHETLTLNGSAFQMELLDTYAGHGSLLSEYREVFSGYIRKNKELQELIEKEALSRKDFDYYKFQFDELDEAGIQPGEQEEKERELEMLSNAEEIKLNLARAHFALDSGEQNIIVSITGVKAIVAEMSKYDPSINELRDRLNSTLIELKDISSELENIEQGVSHQPKKIEELTQRLDLLYRLEKKHHVKTVDELLSIRDELETRLVEINSMEGEIDKLKKEISHLEKVLKEKAGMLSKNRMGAIPEIEREIKKMLAQLGMPDAVLKISHGLLGLTGFNRSGSDKINFMFTANKGAEFREIHKVASGGELSRLMLCLKSLIAQLTSLPAIIFDEIDTGVSGGVADKVGQILERMADSMQVIAITHLPQIASKGKSHFFVYKEEKNKKTVTRVRTLDQEERVLEIAKMLSTQKPGEAAIRNARELLKT